MVTHCYTYPRFFCPVQFLIFEIGILMLCCRRRIILYPTTSANKATLRSISPETTSYCRCHLHRTMEIATHDLEGIVNQCRCSRSKTTWTALLNFDITTRLLSLRFRTSVKFHLGSSVSCPTDFQPPVHTHWRIHSYPHQTHRRIASNTTDFAIITSANIQVLFEYMESYYIKNEKSRWFPRVLSFTCFHW